MLLKPALENGPVGAQGRICAGTGPSGVQKPGPVAVCGKRVVLAFLASSRAPADARTRPGGCYGRCAACGGAMLHPHRRLSPVPHSALPELRPECPPPAPLVERPWRHSREWRPVRMILPFANASWHTSLLYRGLSARFLSQTSSSGSMPCATRWGSRVHPLPQHSSRPGPVPESGVWGPRSNGRKMCGKLPGAKHNFFTRGIARA
jgi:hypothetical protein